MKTHRFVPLPLLLVAACADGGEEDRPQSDVRISAQHHMFGFRTIGGFGSFPVPASAVGTDRGVLNLLDTSEYTVTRSSGTSRAERYALETDGALSIYVSGSSSEPSTLYLGAYGQVGAATSTGISPDYFFTDRVSTPLSRSYGFFYGTRVITGQVELEGNWHVMSLHVVIGGAVLSPDNVGRTARGKVAIAAGTPGTARVISGTGFQGSSSVTFGGQIQNILDGSNQGDGTCNLTLDYQLVGQAADSRVARCAANERVVFALDENSGDGEAGLITMVKAFDVPASPIDSVRVPGTFLVGGHTLFVNPSNSGSDVFVGRVTLTPQGGFTLDAVGNSGQDFTYTGTYSLNTDGSMTISISGTNETWNGAIDRSYNTFVFVDDFQELRANNTPELNFGFGVRRYVP